MLPSWPEVPQCYMISYLDNIYAHIVQSLCILHFLWINVCVCVMYSLSFILPCQEIFISKNRYLIIDSFFSLLF